MFEHLGQTNPREGRNDERTANVVRLLAPQRPLGGRGARGGGRILHYDTGRLDRVPR